MYFLCMLRVTDNYIVLSYRLQCKLDVEVQRVQYST